MALKISDRPIGVIGGGNFGTSIANLLAHNNRSVLLCYKTRSRADEISKTRKSAGQNLNDTVMVTSDLPKLCQDCNIIFPIVPSTRFRELTEELKSYLKPSHIIIHGIKGFVMDREFENLNNFEQLEAESVKTVSQFIRQVTPVVRIGCLAGPNLAKEIAEGQPAASVIASEFNEVIEIGKTLLKSDRFLIYGSSDIIGIELCGILKNIIAIGAGTIAGLGLGDNSKAMFISRGLVEMVMIGKALGANPAAFIGLAGVGDLIATCSSPKSRNFQVGYGLAKAEPLDQIIKRIQEVAEGIRTTAVVRELSRIYKVKCPLTETIYKLLKGDMTVQDAQSYLMKFPFRAEIDFLD